MKRRSKAGGAANKGRRRKTPEPRRRNAPKRVSSSTPILETEVARLTRELNEAREQQTATSEVLQVISSFVGELDPVFQAILTNATSICEAEHGTLFLFSDGTFQPVAAHGASAALPFERLRVEPAPGTGLGRMVSTKAAIQIGDVLTDEDFPRDHPLRSAAERRGVRTLLCVPMIKERELIGAISIFRREVRPFTDKQIELVKNFAAQAVIAIKNARLLNELRQSLEQQTATADVLQVISRSPGHLEPVFATMLEQAVRICDASFGSMVLLDGDMFRRVAIHNAPREFMDFHESRPTVRLSDAFALAQILHTKQVVQIGDVQAEEPETPIAKYGGARTLLTVPLLKENEVIGALGLYRQEVRLFSDKQIALVENFAAQAVIAIENARLLNELRQSLEEQTATSGVLRVISSSPGELEPVFAAMLASATRICEAEFGNLFLREEDAFRAVAWHGEPTYVNTWRGPALIIKTDIADVPLARLAATKQRVHVADLSQEAAYKAGFEPLVALVDKGGARTILLVPMVKEQTLVGAITMYRQEVRPFTDKQIALVENFAAQAVIAIENARLLRELRERTEDVVKLNQQLEQRVVDQVGEIERMGRLRRFLPPQVADLIVASGSEKQLESHRREITALFCDLRGFTGFSESADPEDVMTLLGEYHEAIGESIIKYSGTLERYAGDGVMVVFNDPVPVENPALQAVLMALEMRDAIGALTETWRRWGHEIGFGIGIAHGFATLGTIGFEGRFDYAAIGTVSNVASRLCDEAKPGQILISPRVLTKVENAVKVEPVGEFELKGIRRPLAAYNVLSAAS